MKKLFFAGLLALPALFACSRPALAQAPCVIPASGFAGAGIGAYPTPGCPCPYASCGGICMNFFGRIHFHGPLYNYGPYAGYYPFEPYGPWTSSLQYNPPPAPCKNCGTGIHDRAWKQYALLCFENIKNRIHSIGHKAGKGKWSDCSSCGGTAIAAAPGATAVSIPPLPETAVAVGVR
jgi:hypothetical protein